MLSRVKFSFYPVKSVASSSLTYKVLNSRPLFRFSEEKPKQPLQNTNNAENIPNPLTNETNTSKPYNYDPTRFSQINDQVFLKQQEELEKQRVRDLQKKKTLSFRIPIFCCLLSLFIYYLWQTIPYSVVWKYYLFFISILFTNLNYQALHNKRIHKSTRICPCHLSM